MLVWTVAGIARLVTCIIGIVVIIRAIFAYLLTPNTVVDNCRRYIIDQIMAMDAEAQEALAWEHRDLEDLEEPDEPEPEEPTPKQPVAQPAVDPEPRKSSRGKKTSTDGHTSKTQLGKKKSRMLPPRASNSTRLQRAHYEAKLKKHQASGQMPQPEARSNDSCAKIKPAIEAGLNAANRHRAFKPGSRDKLAASSEGPSRGSDVSVATPADCEDDATEAAATARRAKVKKTKSRLLPPRQSRATMMQRSRCEARLREAAGVAAELADVAA